MPKQLNKVENNERAHRAKTQKIFLANRNIEDNSATFQVLGSTGNIYNVTLNGTPICSCLDHITRGSRCKHILFMLIKIFNVENPYKTTFTQNEIEAYINSYKINISKFNVQIDPNIISKTNISYDVGEKFLDDDCCVCLDPLNNGEERVHCKKICGRCVHLECYNMIKKVSKKCPYCMQKMSI